MSQDKPKLVWSDEPSTTKSKPQSIDVDTKNILLELKRLTSGKGRTVIEIKGLPKNKKWCQDFARQIKKALGVGGTYKADYIEVHGEKLKEVCDYLSKKNIKWKQTGG